MNNTPVLKAQSLGIQFGGLKAVTDLIWKLARVNFWG